MTFLLNFGNFCMKGPNFTPTKMDKILPPSYKNHLNIPTIQNWILSPLQNLLAIFVYRGQNFGHFCIGGQNFWPNLSFWTDDIGHFYQFLTIFYQILAIFTKFWFWNLLIFKQILASLVWRGHNSPPKFCPLHTRFGQKWPKFVQK